MRSQNLLEKEITMRTELLSKLLQRPDHYKKEIKAVTKTLRENEEELIKLRGY